MFEKEFQKRRLLLEKNAEEAKKQLKNLPEGRLRISGYGKACRYYHMTEKGDSNGKYISRNKVSLIAGLAQRDYLTKYIKHAEGEVQAIDKYLSAAEKYRPRDIYAKYNGERKKLTLPLEISDEEYAVRWQAEEYRGGLFYEDTPEYYTKRGERVRSKSEVLIANALFDLGIPYKYECPVMLKNHTEVRPDFTCLKMDERKIIYYEHFGRMDDEEYVEKFMWKMVNYPQSGIIPGSNLIMTFETKLCPLSSREIMTLLREIFFQ